MKATERFGSRVENYVKFRPGYPREVIDDLVRSCGLRSNESPSVIVDVGSGTGLSAELFLKSGLSVVGVEPNDKMRLAAERYLASYPAFKSVNGTAEATGLSDHSADLVFAAQAFHWFDPKLAKAEFRRILKPKASVALIWNDRKTSGSSFLVAYEDLLNSLGTDYREINHRNIDSQKVSSFLGAHEERLYSNFQDFDFEGLAGRLNSSSYAIPPGSAGYEKMMSDLRDIFDQHQENGRVRFEYDTRVFLALNF